MKPPSPKSSETAGISTAVKAPKRGGILNSLLYIFLFPVYLLAKIIPKNRRLCLFGSRHGLAFADNGKYLFLYASKHFEGFRCVFMSRNRHVVSQLDRAGYDACYALSVRGIIAAVRAKWCFISHSTHDVHPLLIGGAEVIQLWHGTPLKKIGYDAMYGGRGGRGGMKDFLRRTAFDLFPYLNASMHFQHLVVDSENVRDSFRSAFRIPDGKIRVLGQPRNDTLAGEFQFNPTVFPEVEYLEHLRTNFQTVITWMPTHRLISGGNTASLLIDYGFDSSDFEKFLTDQKACLIIKVHPLDRRGLGEMFSGSERILVYEFADPYPLLKNTDMLLTDYSSVYLDFLLTKRPIVFTPFDIDEYMTNDASFYYDFESVTPGPKCRNWSEVQQTLKELMQSLREGESDRFAMNRHEMCMRFNDFVGGNAKRVLSSFLKDSTFSS